MQDLGRPEGHQNVCLRDKAARDRQALRKFTSEVGALGVEAAGEVLDVGKVGLVLDVQEGAAGAVNRNDVRPAGELVVLVWLIKVDFEARRSKLLRLDLAHGSVDGIGIAVRLSGTLG